MHTKIEKVKKKKKKRDNPKYAINICTYIYIFNKIIIIKSCVQGSFQLSLLILCLAIAVTIFIYFFFFWVWHSTRFLGEQHGDAPELQKGAFVSGVLFERTTRCDASVVPSTL